MKLIKLLEKYSSEELVDKLVKVHYKVKALDLEVPPQQNYSTITRQLFCFFKSLIGRHHRIKYKFYNVNNETNLVITNVCKYIGIKNPIIN